MSDAGLGEPQGALINRVMTTLIQKVKGDPTYVVDADLAPRDLAVEMRRRGISLIRAQWKLRGVSGSRLRFAEDGVSITHRRLLTLGKGCVVEAHARFHCLSTDGFVFGDSVTIGKFSIIESGGVLWNRGVGLTVGRGANIGDYCFIGASGGVTIGERVLMGQRVSIHSQNHNFDDTETSIQSQGVRQEGVVIADDCWLGSGAIILDGVELGEGCVVAAGSVVSKSFGPGSVIAGVPAKLIKTRDSGESPEAALATSSGGAPEAAGR